MFLNFLQDAGHAILESYSRILESLAFSVMSRIEDVLYADSLTQDPSLKDSTRRYSLSDSETPAGPAKKLDPKVEMEKLKEAPNSMTLWDFMGWHFDSEESKTKEDETADLKKPPKIEPTKKFSYIEKVEHLGGLRSPTARH